MKKLRIRIPIMALAVGLAAVISVYGSTSAEGAQKTKSSGHTAAASDSIPSNPTPKPRPLPHNVTINVSEGVSGASETYLAAQLAQYFGEFQKENLTVNFSKNTDADVVPLLSSNKLQAGVTGMNAGILNAIQSGSTMRWVLPIARVAPGDLTGIWARNVVLSHGKLNPCALGTGIANGTTRFSFGSSIGAGSTLIPYLDNLVARCKGLSLKTVLDHITPSSLSGPNLLVGLQQGSLDLSVLYDPLVTEPGIRGYASPVITVEQMPDVNDQDQAGWMLSGQFMKEQPKAAEAFLRALVRTERTYLQGNYLKNPAVLQAMSSVTGLPISSVKQFPNVIFDPVPMHSDKFIATIQKDWNIVGGILSYNKPLKPGQLVDESLLNKVLAEK